MNQHLDDGLLRASLDGELQSEALRHLETCKQCQDRQTALQGQLNQTVKHLAFLSSPSPQANYGIAPRTALGRFKNQASIKKENPMFRRLFASPALRIGFAVLALLALVVAIPSTRALADQLLNLFRVQQVTVVPVDFTGMQQLTGDNTFSKQISQLLSSSITMTQKPGEPVNASDAAQASQLAGFNVRLPGDMTPAHIMVQQGAAFSFKVDRNRAQALLDEAGRKDLVLPADIDGANISVKIPAGVSVAYGECPAASMDEPGIGLGGSNGRRYPDCVILAEIPSPTVNAPANVDVAQLAQIGLEFTGMNPQEAAAFAKTVDWTSSLVIPIPKNAATYKQIPVDGVTGTLIQRPVDDAPQYALIWVKDGVIYAIGGLGSNTQQALQMASSLH